MKLKELLKGIDYKIVQGNVESEIKNVNYDSRKVEKGDMFVCIKGFQADGHKYAEGAIKKEINAVICEDDITTDNKDVTIIKTTDTIIITNGKTSRGRCWRRIICIKFECCIIFPPCNLLKTV